MKFNIPAEHKNASGVYIIRNSVNDKVYVGSAVNLRRRYREHARQLARLEHHSYKLQLFANKYGVDILSFDLIEVAEAKEERLLREQYWMDFHSCYRTANGFNISPLATSTAGSKRRPEIYTPEYREKLTLAFLGKQHSPEARALMSEAKRGKPAPWSDERKANARALRKPQTEETRRKRSEALKGRIVSEETRAKISEANKGKRLSLTDEQRGQYAKRLATRITPEIEARRIVNLKAYHEERRAAKPQEPARLPLPPGYKRPPLTDKRKRKLSNAKKGKPSSTKARKFSEEHMQAAQLLLPI